MTQPAAPESGLFRRDNGYDALRLLLAAIVIFAHSFPIGGFGNDPGGEFFQHQMLLGHMAVLGFFGLSGFLVAASCERSQSPVSFLRKRFLRIFPGYWCCLLVCAFAFAPAIAAVRGLMADFSLAGEHGALGYVAHNFFLIIRQQTVGQLLVGLPHSTDLNSSLWSLWPEFFCYACLALLGVAGGLTRNRPLTLIAVLLLAAFHLLRLSNPALHAPLLPVQIDQTIYLPFLLSFAVGVALYAWRASFTPSLAATAVIGVVMLYVLRTGGFALAGPVLVPLLVVFSGACFRLHLKHDLSYGLYIYSFPAQQLIFATMPNISWPAYVLASFALSLVCACASWFLVERHFLRARATVTAPVAP